MRGKPRRSRSGYAPTKPPSGSASTSARPSTSPMCWMRQDRRCSPAPSRTTRPPSRRSSLARSPSAPRHWSSTSPARWPGSCSVSPPAAACRWHTCRGWSCAGPPTSTRVSPRPTAATRSCWPTPAARGATRCTGSMPATTNSWSSCAFSTATTPTSPPMPRGSRTGCATPSLVSHRPWSAYWAPNSTMRGHGTCSPATRHRRRWPRRVAAASRGRSGSARRASRRRSPRPSPRPSAPRPWSYPARSRWAG